MRSPRPRLSRARHSLLLLLLPLFPPLSRGGGARLLRHCAGCASRRSHRHVAAAGQLDAPLCPCSLSFSHNPTPFPPAVHREGPPDGGALRPNLGKTPKPNIDTANLKSLLRRCLAYALLQVDAFIFLGVFGSSGGAGSFAAHAAAAWVFWASTLVLALVIVGVILHPHVLQVAAAGACVTCGGV